MIYHGADKIVMLKGSMRCFAFGLLGLLPGLGLPFAMLALWNAIRVRALEREYWNAAKPYRIWGVILAVLGIICFNGPVLFFLGYNFVTNIHYFIYGSD